MAKPIKPEQLNQFMLLDPPRDYNLRAAIDLVLHLRLGGLVFNNLIIRVYPTDTIRDILERYHRAADKLAKKASEKPEPSDFQI